MNIRDTPCPLCRSTGLCIDLAREEEPLPLGVWHRGRIEAAARREGYASDHDRRIAEDLQRENSPQFLKLERESHKLSPSWTTGKAAR